MENLIIVGTGVNAVRAFKFINKYKLYNVIGFAVDKEYIKDSKFYNLPLYDLENLKTLINVPFKVFVALLWNRLNADRRKLFEKCERYNYEFVNLISPYAVIHEDVKLGKNCWVYDFVSILNDSIIGNNVGLMSYCLIGGGCQIASHSFFAGKTSTGGSCIIGEQSFIGFNATILDGTHIGKKCIVGAGSLVKRNLPDFTRCVTPSDNNIIKQYKEDEIESKLLFSKNVR